MRAMILSAGSGKRMRPLTNNIPKPMLVVNGKPLIQYHVENLVAAGIVDIVINHARFGEQIEAHLNNGQHLGADIVYSKEGQKPLETAGGIAKALPLLGDQPFVTVNADIWTDFPFQTLLNIPNGKLGGTLGHQSKHIAHIILVDNPKHNSKGDFCLNNEQILNQGEPMLTFSGISVFTPEFFQGCVADETSLTPLLRLAASQGQITGSYYQGLWQDIGTPECLAALQAQLES